MKAPQGTAGPPGVAPQPQGCRRHATVPKAGARFPLFLLSWMAVACRPVEPPPVEHTWRVMDTTVTLSMPAARADGLDDAVQRARRRLDAVVQTFSAFNPESELGRVNARAGTGFVAVSPEMAAVCRQALHLARTSGGAFDPTIGPLMELWGFRAQVPDALPSPERIAAVRAQTGWRHVRLDESHPAAPRIALERAGMRLDLGAMAKGHALDRVYHDLAQAGYADFMMNLGGDIRVRGRPAPRRDHWRVGVRNPFQTGQILGTFHLAGGEAVTTSGHYERFRVVEGRRVAHIVDPRSGRPVEGMAGVTVVASSAVEADGLSTALFVLGIEAGGALLTQHPGAAALWIPDRQPVEIWVSPGMAQRFAPLPGLSAAVRTAPPPP